MEQVELQLEANKKVKKKVPFDQAQIILHDCEIKFRDKDTGDKLPGWELTDNSKYEFKNLKLEKKATKSSATADK